MPSAPIARVLRTPPLVAIGLRSYSLYLWHWPVLALLALTQLGIGYFASLLLVPVEEPGAPDLSSWGAFAVATLANITLYAVLAGLVWLGLAKSRWVLAFPLLIVAGVWYSVWHT